MMLDSCRFRGNYNVNDGDKPYNSMRVVDLSFFLLLEVVPEIPGVRRRDDGKKW